jgi:hypothetical protein
MGLERESLKLLSGPQNLRPRASVRIEQLDRLLKDINFMATESSADPAYGSGGSSGGAGGAAGGGGVSPVPKSPTKPVAKPAAKLPAMKK